MRIVAASVPRRSEQARPNESKPGEIRETAETHTARRTHHLLREFIELQTAMVAIGACDVRYAAHQMAINGVPLAVALRTLTGRKA